EYRRNGSESLKAPRTVRPEDHQLPRTELDRLRGGDAAENARLILDVLNGATGPHRAVVVLNAAYALQTSGKFSDLEACFAAAEESIDSGAARRVLERLVDASNTAPAEA